MSDYSQALPLGQDDGLPDAEFYSHEFTVDQVGDPKALYVELVKATNNGWRIKMRVEYTEGLPPHEHRLPTSHPKHPLWFNLPEPPQEDIPAGEIISKQVRRQENGFTVVQDYIDQSPSINAAGITKVILNVSTLEAAGNRASDYQDVVQPYGLDFPITGQV